MAELGGVAVGAPAFSDAWARIQADTARTVGLGHEFPLTAMSRAVAECIWTLRPDLRPKFRSALDVGTGTGVHALVMKERGFEPVVGIDSCDRAIFLARRRAGRLEHALQKPPEMLAGGRPHRQSRKPDGARLEFRVVSLDRVATVLPQERALIAFNPPSFYAFSRERSDFPAYRGVYVDDDWQLSTRPEFSALYRFFKSVVLPLLAEGGHIVCTWPGLERRAVERVGASVKDEGRVVHPVTLLREWFGLRVNAPSQMISVDRFFSMSASIESDYGLGPSFWANLRLGKNSGLYSRLLEFDPDAGHFPRFRYGVLHLVRRGPDQRTFDFVDYP